MRRNRIILIILWVLSLVGISFFGGPVSYGFFWAVTLTPIVSLAYLWAVYSCFRTYQKVGTRNIVANTSAPFFFTLQNGVFFTFSGIKLHFFSSFSTITGLEDNLEYELLPGARIDRETQVVCKYRGEYEIGVKYLEITDFLRLFTIKFSPKETLSVIVNPYLAEVTALRQIDTDRVLPKAAMVNPLELDNEVRDYVSGDPMRFIHWNASAKEQTLKVRKQIGEEKQGITIITDTERGGKTLQEQLPAENKIVETTLAIAFYLAKKNIPVSIYYNQNTMKKAELNNISAFDAFYKEMAGLSFREEYKLSAMIDAMMNSRDVRNSRVVVMVLHEWNKETERMAEIFSRDNIPSVIYVMGDKKETTILPGIRANVTYVPYDADLKEVL